MGILIFIYILFTCSTSYFYLGGGEFPSAFRMYYSTPDETSEIINDDDYVKYKPSENEHHKTGFEIHLPYGVSRSGYLRVLSEKTQMMLYSGHYISSQPVILDADSALFDQNGLDILRIKYIDTERNRIYVCQQQTAFQTWEADTIAVIDILLYRKIDKSLEDLSYCYETNKYKKITPQ